MSEEWQMIPHNPGDPQPMLRDGQYRAIKLGADGTYWGIPAQRADIWRTDGTAPSPQEYPHVIVRVVQSYRWLPYHGKSEQFRKGIKGRWQRATEYGWENSSLPEGCDWKPNPKIEVKP